ncbi:STAS/SEC14 domain-containing protein [Pseudokineococcus basanitobsidens]|uniref:STAS/SEC14 domain-containing protein n=1 Tax=Pseudokineococcus basanitobsidens TaxID=1926649 RepID=A0ABU8RI19_9ACTN
MLTTSPVEGTNVVTIRLSGGVTTDEEQAAKRQLAEVAAAHGGTARVLLDYDGVDLAEVEPKAAWEDLKGAKLLDDVDRAAVVGAPGALEALASAGAAVTSLEVRTFDAGRRDEALAWLTSKA